MSDPLESLDEPVITREEAARAIVNCFLANADAGNHAANDELIAELARRQREHRDQLGDRKRSACTVAGGEPVGLTRAADAHEAVESTAEK